MNNYSILHHTEPSPWSRTSRRVAYENPWLRVDHDEVIRPDGRPGIYGVIHYRNLSVGIVAIDARDKVLLVGQYRYAIGRYSWEIPAGGCPEGGDPATTARRELQEETGYTADSLQLLLHAHMSNSVSDEEGRCYLATGLQPGAAAPEGTEQILMEWVDFSEALQAIAGGLITDALTILGLQQAALIRTKGNAMTANSVT